MQDSETIKRFQAAYDNEDDDEPDPHCNECGRLRCVCPELDELSEVWLC